MNKILLASHGPLANGMKKTAEFLMGQNENVETLCAYVDEQSKDLPGNGRKVDERKKIQKTSGLLSQIYLAEVSITNL